MQNENTPTEGQNSTKLEAESALRDAACSPCDSAFARFHDDRRKDLLDYIEERVANHVADGGNDSPSYRKDAAFDGMRDLPGHSDRDIWNAAWKACLENAEVVATAPRSLE